MTVIHSTCYPIFGSFTIFNSTVFENFKTISLLNLLIWKKFWTKKTNPLKNSLMSSMQVVWNKEKKYLDKAVWVNHIVLFLRSFCFMIELLAFQVNNIKLCLSRRYCRPISGQYSFLCPLKTSKNIGFLMFPKGIKN